MEFKLAHIFCLKAQTIFLWLFFISLCYKKAQKQAFLQQKCQ
jgi:hypothetical protein